MKKFFEIFVDVHFEGKMWIVYVLHVVRESSHITNKYCGYYMWSLCGRFYVCVSIYIYIQYLYTIISHHKQMLHVYVFYHSIRHYRKMIWTDWWKQVSYNLSAYPTCCLLVQLFSSNRSRFLGVLVEYTKTRRNIRVMPNPFWTSQPMFSFWISKSLWNVLKFLFFCEAHCNSG